jgi:diguanylate cyclase (GGDEF)-like protein
MTDHASEREHEHTQRAGDGDRIGQRRRASSSLWSACEALLSSDRRAMQRALDELATAFECDGVALHAMGPDGELEPWCARGRWQQRPGELRACLSIPLRRGEEQVGTLDLVAPPGRAWNADRYGLVRTAAGALGAALGTRIELERLREQPGRDPVTGLPDGAALRMRIAQELSRSRRDARPVTLVVLDLDHFGALNTRFGRTTGDQVLAETALVLRIALREADVLARMGGDQFGILLPDTEPLPASRVAERLARTLEEHRFERVGRISASCGVATGPRAAADPLELMDQAEKALGLAKKNGRRRVSGAPATGIH